MTANERWILRAMAALVASLAAGCTGARPVPTDLQAFTWWTELGEIEALDKVRTIYERRHPETLIRSPVPGGSMAARQALNDNMVAGYPPDTFQANGGWDLFHWVLYNGVNDFESKMKPLDSFAASEGSAFVSAVLETVQYRGKVYAVPLDVHRVNTLFFNRHVFAQAGVAEPTRTDDLDHLFEIAHALKDQGVIPFAVGMQDSWTLAITLFENLLVAGGGASYYRDFFCGNGAMLPDEPIRAAIERLGTILSPGYRTSDAGRLNWAGAVERVRAGGAAMVIMGDWAKGYFLAKGAGPDDFGEVPMPGTGKDGIFVFTTDTFGLPLGAPHEGAARELLKLFGSKEGQDAFNPTKGSTSPRLDTDRQQYDLMGQVALDDFHAAADDPAKLVRATALLARPDFMAKITDVLGDFAESSDADVMGNASIVLHTLKNHYDMLTRPPSLCSRPSGP